MKTKNKLSFEDELNNLINKYYITDTPDFWLARYVAESFRLFKFTSEHCKTKDKNRLKNWIKS